MRKLTYIICLCVLILASCTKSPEDKADVLIKPFLNKAFPNIESYEPIEFGKIATAHIEYKETAEYFRLSQEMKELLAEMDMNADILKTALSKSEIIQCTQKNEELYNKIHALHDSIDAKETNFTYDTTRVCIFHSFRYYDEEKNSIKSYL